jgi:glutamate/tyrosine decarboxylase-like PLP-dependent enzyme
MDDDDLRRAALRSVDPERLLPGEERDLRSTTLRDAAHWTAVYAELLDFKRDLIREVTDRFEHVADATRAELDNDLVILVAEESRLDGRHRFWSARRRELAGDSGDNSGIT